jgi:dolichol-phosphate mannosyltransferase
MALKYKKSDTLAVVIPVYNEATGIAKCIQQVISEISKLPFKVKLILVNDSSTDNSLDIIKQQVAKNKKFAEVISTPRNAGYGGAIQFGTQHALRNKFKYAIFMDSDLTNDPADIYRLMETAVAGYDLVKASRYVSGGQMVGVPLYRQIISMAGNLLAAPLFGLGIKDCTNGFRLVRLNKLKGARFSESGFSSILEELLYLKKVGARATEISVTLISRTDTSSSFIYQPRTFFSYLKYAIMAVKVKSLKANLS